MRDWNKIKAGLEWGLFYGIVTWLVFTALTNKTPALGIWGMILSRLIIGVLAAVVVWEKPWWIRGLTWGLAGHLPLGVLSLIPLGRIWDQFFFGWTQSWILMLITALIMGVLTELSMIHREKSEAAIRS
ncbi:hypothetical protein KAR48_07140 [bacterium]|nr:hypothetical protein [bacterium]